MNLNRFEKFFLTAFSAVGLFLAISCAKEGDGRRASVPGSETPIAEISFVAFDTETTGFSPASNRIVELAAVKFRNGKIVDKRQWLVNPGVDIPYFATNVHGIDNAMVAGKPPFAEVYREFLDFADDAVLIAHNSRFDRDFMRAEMKRAGIESSGLPLLDSLKLFKEMTPDASSYSIGKLVEYFEIEPGNFHRALVDSAYIFKIMAKAIDGGWDEIAYGKLVEYNNGRDAL